MAGEIFCIAEVRGGQVLSGGFEILTAARSVAGGAKVAAVLLGRGVKEHAKTLGEHGADVVYVADHESLEHFNDELAAGVLAKLIEAEKPAAVLVPPTVLGRSLATRAAPLAKLGLAADVSELKKDGDAFVAVRACCGGGQLVDIAFKGAFVATVAKGSFAKAEAETGRAHEVKEVAVDPSSLKTRTTFIEHKAPEHAEKDITEVEIIVSGGYGLGKKEGFGILEELAGTLGGAIGASRRAVDSGWIPYSHQVGLTGRTVKPKLYLACGISGQIQHLAGMSSSDTIVAINSDKDAPLMKLATFAVEGDLFEIVPALTELIKKDRGNGSR